MMAEEQLELLQEKRSEGRAWGQHGKAASPRSANDQRTEDALVRFVESLLADAGTRLVTDITKAAEDMENHWDNLFEDDDTQTASNMFCLALAQGSCTSRHGSQLVVVSIGAQRESHGIIAVRRSRALETRMRWP